MNVVVYICLLGYVSMSFFVQVYFYLLDELFIEKFDVDPIGELA